MWEGGRTGFLIEFRHELDRMSGLSRLSRLSRLIGRAMVVSQVDDATSPLTVSRLAADDGITGIGRLLDGMHALRLCWI
jgi:hypothetical protein